LSSVSLECRDALDVITAYGRKRRTLLYADPPYLGSVRERNYRHEMRRDTQHRALAEALHDCVATVVVSGYAKEPALFPSTDFRNASADMAVECNETRCADAAAPTAARPAASARTGRAVPVHPVGRGSASPRQQRDLGLSAGRSALFGPVRISHVEGAGRVVDAGRRPSTSSAR
jgi:hypothetical protein